VPSPSSPPGRKFRYVLVVALAILASSAYAFVHLGRFLAAEDPLQNADAMFVLAGSRMNRPLEAADLYKAGVAPRIVMTFERSEESFAALRERGITIPANAEASRDVLIHLGVPAAAILIPLRIHDNTAQEAQTLRELAMMYGWKRVVVVSSKYHLRRAGFAMRRELRGTGIEVVMHGTRYGAEDPAHWWARRGDVRFILDEIPKLIAYELGLGP
jgi:uncharacterized SAM-binding protein YcdF (DUF218 family)